MSRDPAPRRRLDDESGIALIFVLFAVMILAGSAAIVFSIAQAETRATREARDFENALPVTEAGIDAVIATLNQQKNFTTQCAAAAADCYADPPGSPTNTGTTTVYRHLLNLGAMTGTPEQIIQQQKVWALRVASDPTMCNAALDPSIFLDNGNGEVCAIRPVNPSGQPIDLLFGVGFVPSRANPDKVRVVRIEYDRGFFSPTKAVLTQGDLIVQGAIDIDGDGNPDPRLNTGSVHTNSSVTLVGGSPSIEGELTYSGTLTGTAIPNSRKSPPEYIPPFTADELYFEHEGRTTTWWNLCPDGTIRTINATPVDTEPCDGTGETTVYDAKAAGAPASYNGFAFQKTASPPTWDIASRPATGVYYAYRTKVTAQGTKGKIGGLTDPAVFSLIVEATSLCPGTTDDGTGTFDQGGNLNWKPYVNDILVVADRDVKIRGNPSGGTNEAQGWYGAVEQVSLGGNTSLRGSMLGRDLCDTPSSPVTKSEVFGSVQVTHLGGMSVPVESLIRVTAWNEI